MADNIMSAFTDFSTGDTSVSILLGLTDMYNVEEHIKTDDVARYYYERDYVRVRIPTIHGLNPKSTWYESFKTDEAAKKILDNIYVDSKDLPWARIILQTSLPSNNTLFSKLGITAKENGKAIRDDLGITDETSELFYMLSVGGDLSQLLIIGRPAVVSGNKQGGSHRSSRGTSYSSIQTSVFGQNAAKGFQVPSSYDGSATEEFGEDASSWKSGDRTIHVGLDYTKGGNPKPNIYPVTKGTVISIYSESTSGGWGNFVIMEHTLKYNNTIYYYYSGYAHMGTGSVSVSIGQEITNISETKLGVMSYTGECYPQGDGGTHLHFCVFSNSSASKMGPVTMPQGYVENSRTQKAGVIGPCSYNYYYYAPDQVMVGGEEKLIELMKSAGVLS